MGEKAHCYTDGIGVCRLEVTLGNGSVKPVLIEAVTPVPCGDAPSIPELGIICPALLVSKSPWVKCLKQKSVVV